MKIFPIPFTRHISILIAIIIIGHFSLIFLHRNISSFIDFYLLLFFFFNFKLDKADYKLYILSFSIILLILLRYLISDSKWDSTYFFISLKLLIFFLMFISIKPKLNMNKAHLIKLLQRCYLIACALVISDKVLAFSGGIFNGIVFRPRLIGEINFDIILIIQLWLLLKLYMPGYKKIYGYLLFFVVIISLTVCTKRILFSFYPFTIV